MTLTPAQVYVLDYRNAAVASLKELVLRCRPNTTEVRVETVTQPGLHTMGISFLNHGPRIEARLYFPTFLTAATRITRQQADVFTGYWVHEALHVVYSDMNRMAQHHNQAAQAGLDFLALQLYDHLYNALEDVRMEHLAIRAGHVAVNLKACLARLRRWSYQDAVDRCAQAGEPHPLNTPEQIAYTLKIVLNVVLLGLDLPQVAADWAAHTALHGALAAEIADMVAHPLTTQEHVHQRALALVKLWSKQQTPQPRRGDDTDGDESSSTPETHRGSDGSSDRTSDEDRDASEGDDPSEPTVDDSRPDEDSGRGSGHDEPADSSQGDDTSEDGDPSDGDAPDGDSQPGVGDGATDSGESDLASLFAGPGVGGKRRQLDDNLENLFARQAQALDPDEDDYPDACPVLNAETVEIKPWTHKRPGFAQVKKLIKKSAALETDLRYLVKSPARTGVIGHKVTGRLQSRALPRALAGSDDVFQRRWVRPGHNTAVLILADISGSMMAFGSRKLDVMKALLAVVGDTLDLVKTPLAIVAYEGQGHLVKSFFDPWAKTRDRVTALIAIGGTRLTPTLATAAAMFNTLPPSWQVTRRAVFIIGDGDDDSGPGALKTCLQTVRQVYNIDAVYGLGINTDMRHWALDGAESVDPDRVGIEGLKLLRRALARAG